MKTFLFILAFLFSSNLFAVISSFEKLIPVGTVIAFVGATCPSGFISPNGAQIVKTQYPTLCTLLGNIYGTGTSTTCYLPDYRGKFLRGIDGGSGNDPDTSSRIAMQTGGNTGNNIGSVQTDALQGHSHGIRTYTSGGLVAFVSQGYINGGTGNNSSYQLTVPGLFSDGTYGTPVTSTETRPRNVYVNYCIKY